jgi:hypothetical protein
MHQVARWLFLIHQIPPKPDYLRVKIGRRLQRIGAVALKKTVYVLPKSDSAAEDFDWIRREVTDAGGDATVIDAALVTGTTDTEIEQLFKQARDEDYDTLASDAQAVAAKLAAGVEPRSISGDVTRFERRFDEIAALDFFGAPGAERARATITALRAAVRGDASDEPDVAEPPRGRTWVTRAGVHVDRIASSWLIRRFIDPDASFKFVPPKGYVPLPGELRFDMSDAEYTHEGDLCSFEVLQKRLGPNDAAVAIIGEIIHDLDVRDGKYNRAENAGFAALINGIALVHGKDEDRLRVGFELLDAMLAAFRKTRAGA